MDWFERLTGFKEISYEQTKLNLEVNENRLFSKVNGKSYQFGEFHFLSLENLREKVSNLSLETGKISVNLVEGNVKELHTSKNNIGSLFQVASQFNLLEMVSPNVGPEDGVTRYQYDRTQGPACAMSCGAATIFRNYFIPIQDQFGQKSSRQVDCLLDMGKCLSKALNIQLSDLWKMQNGYALCSEKGLISISDFFNSINEHRLDKIRGLLKVGIHFDAEVTQSIREEQIYVSQIFCSAMPVAYSNAKGKYWEVFASFILEAAYEATLLTAVINAQRTGSNILYLTLLGGGAFGNRNEWIYKSIGRAINLMRNFNIDVRIVSFGSPQVELIEFVNDFK